jgi:hypothetical protein
MPFNCANRSSLSTAIASRAISDLAQRFHYLPDEPGRDVITLGAPSCVVLTAVFKLTVINTRLPQSEKCRRRVMFWNALAQVIHSASRWEVRRREAGVEADVQSCQAAQHGIAPPLPGLVQ